MHILYARLNFRVSKNPPQRLLVAGGKMVASHIFQPPEEKRSESDTWWLGGWVAGLMVARWLGDGALVAKKRIFV